MVDRRMAQLVAALMVCGAMATPAGASAQPLYGLKQMDMHLHSGLERQVPLGEWIDLAVADGRKVIVALDHRELYDMTPEARAAWVKESGHAEWYPTGMAGRRVLMADLAGLRSRKDVLAFVGWEISEAELDGKLDRESMRLPEVEVIGWHISPNSPVAPCGQTLLKRVRQVIAVQREFRVPMVMFHPFPMRIERIQKDARSRGQALSTLTVADYRFFRPGEQEELARLLRGRSIYIEIGRATGSYWKDPVVRQAFIEDIKQLADLGVRFTVSTDNHYVASAKAPFEPDVYCPALGVTPANTNGLVQEMLRRR